MVYIGRVLSNKNFGSKGTIDIILYQKYNALGLGRKWASDISDIIDDVQNNVSSSDCFGKESVECLVAGGIGNLYNAGEFQLPQIGALGLILEIENSESWQNISYIWLGGVYGYRAYGAEVSLPNDDTDCGLGQSIDQPITGSDDEDNVSDSEYYTGGRYILKTKTCQADNYDYFESTYQDPKYIEADNTFVLDKNKAALKHSVKSEGATVGVERIIFNEDGISLIREYGEEGVTVQTHEISESEDGITISYSNSDTKKSGKIVIDNKGNLTIEASGNADVNIEGNADVSVGGNASVNSKGTMSMVSDGKMKIQAAGINLATVISNLADDVKYLKTFGNPSLHTTMVTDQTKIDSNVKTLLSTGYN